MNKSPATTRNETTLERRVARVFAVDAPWPPSARLVALAVAFHMGPADHGGGWVGWPSIARLAAATNLSAPTVKRALVALCSGPRPLFAKRFDADGKQRIYLVERWPA